MPLSSLKKPAVGIWVEPGDIIAVISDGIFEYCNRDGEEFGEERVRQAIKAHAGGTMERLAQSLFDAVKAFAEGTPQEDDMTIVLVKRK